MSASAKSIVQGVVEFSENGDTFTPRANMRTLGLKLSGVADGKIYQILHNGDGITTLYQHVAEATNAQAPMFEPLELLLVAGRTYTFDTTDDPGLCAMRLYVRA